MIGTTQPIIFLVAYVVGVVTGALLTTIPRQKPRKPPESSHLSPVLYDPDAKPDNMYYTS